MKEILKDYAQYNFWANKRVANWLQDIPMDKLKTEMKSSYISIFSILNHILTAEKFWLSRITETKFELPEIKADSLIFGKLTKQSEIFKDTIHVLEQDILIKKVEVKLKTRDLELEGKYSVAELIQHGVNHSTYHRGQIIILARNLGIEDKIPSTDFFIYKMNKQKESIKSTT